MHFDLTSEITRADSLEELEVSFSNEEIDNIIRELPKGKSLVSTWTL
jgi:hypothetical protein